MRGGNTQGGEEEEILREERRRKNTQGGEEEEGGATGERERVTISRCQPAHLHLSASYFVTQLRDKNTKKSQMCS